MVWWLTFLWWKILLFLLTSSDLDCCSLKDCSVHSIFYVCVVTLVVSHFSYSYLDFFVLQLKMMKQFLQTRQTVCQMTQVAVGLNP